MKDLQSVAVVVVAQDHNPTILHPSFLESQQIVPADHQLAEPPICSPAVAQVRYRGGLNFRADLGRLEIRQDSPTGVAPSTIVPACARRYVETLPHVRYVGVGINLSKLSREPEPRLTLMRRFLRDGPWNDTHHALRSLDLRLTYDLADGPLTVTIQPFVAADSDDSPASSGLLVAANYHLDVTDLESTVRAIDRFADRWTHFEAFVNDILGKEE